VVTSEIHPAEAVGGRGPQHRWKRWRWSVGTGVFVAAMLVAFTLAAHDQDRASSLYPYYDVNQTGRLAVGATMFVGGDVQPRGYNSGHHLIDLRALLPRITINSAHATIRVMECTLADPHLGIGMARPDQGRRICAQLRPFRPGNVDLGFPATEIIYVVTPTTAGRVRVEGADVSYLDGSRPGNQHAGGGFALRAARVTN
jgi:hypothetical protein